MNENPSHPVLFQINARPWVQRLDSQLGRSSTLDDISDAELDEISERGFDWVYLLGVWQTGENGRKAALRQHRVHDEYRIALPDVEDQDVCGSCFAIADYTVTSRLGGDEAMLRFHQRLKSRGIQLMLDFVPNHTAIDHHWAYQHPDYYISGSAQDLRREPANYTRVQTARGTRILAHGRDPYFPGWNDTLQLNYANPKLQEAMFGVMEHVAGLCDGLRCDMAMLLLPGVIERTWGKTAQPFWPIAIERTRRAHPGFVFLAEVYWGLEWSLQQQGFDYTYDKGLYDRLRDLHARPVREHLQADRSYQNHLARFLENHDEQRAASVFTDSIHPAAAVITYLTPGMRFFHQGQLEGALERLPVQLCRAPEFQANEKITGVYTWLLELLKQPAFHTGAWQLINAFPGSEADDSWENIIAWAWSMPEKEVFLTVVNYSPTPARCTLRLPLEGLRGQERALAELWEGTHQIVTGDALMLPGLLLELPAWGVRVFRIE